MTIGTQLAGHRPDGRRRMADDEILLAEERDRIARDLHDTVLQRIFATGLTLQAAALRAPNRDVRDCLDAAVVELDTAIREIRSAIFGLHGPSRYGGLREALMDAAAEAARILGFTPAVHFVGPLDSALPDESGRAIVAVVREALSNVARHARATHVAVDVEVGDDAVLRVADDGVGFTSGAHRDGGRGLADMEERAWSLGGSCHFVVPPEGGTLLEWRIPLKENGSAA